MIAIDRERKKIFLNSRSLRMLSSASIFIIFLCISRRLSRSSFQFTLHLPSTHAGMHLKRLGCLTLGNTSGTLSPTGSTVLTLLDGTTESIPKRLVTFKSVCMVTIDPSHEGTDTFSFVPRAPGLVISRSYGRGMPARGG